MQDVGPPGGPVIKMRARSSGTWVRRLILLAAAAAAALPGPGVPVARAQAVSPAPPQAFLDTAYTPPSGQIIAVPAGGDLQAALNSANPGDIITLAAGATFTGPLVLPHKPGAGWLYVRPRAPHRALPSPGTRIDPPHAPQLPTSA